MTEQERMDAFEKRFTALARAYTDPADRSVDALVTARSAMASTARGSAIKRRWQLGLALDRRIAWALVAAAMLVALVALAIAAGTIRQPAGHGRLVFVRDGELFTAEVDGSGQVKIATRGVNGASFGYLSALWAPDGRHIAATRDGGGEFLTPAVDLMTADGALVRSVELGPGGTPSITWSPNGARIAIAAYAAEIARDAIEPIAGSDVQLRIVGLDPSADREMALPPDWRGIAASGPEISTVPDLGARWSPDDRWIALRVGLAIAPEQTLGWHLVAVDGSGTRRVEDLVDDVGGLVESMDWSPDGRLLATSGQVGCLDGGCISIVDVQHGLLSATVTHPSNAEPNLHGKLLWPEFSSNGDRVAVLGNLIDFTSEPAVTETYTLYVYDLAAARLTELTSGSRPMILDTSGAVHPNGTATGEFVEGATAAWAPDGLRLLYLVREAGDAPAGWTIRSIDPAGRSRSAVIARSVQSFDLGFSK
jgi:Tol biopolymer transport system component